MDATIIQTFFKYCVSYMHYDDVTSSDTHNLINELEKHLPLAPALLDPITESNLYFVIAYLYHNVHRPITELKYYKRGLKLARDCELKDTEMNVCRRMGIAFASLKKYDKAIEYFNSSLAIAKEIGDTIGEGSAYTSLGDVCMSKGENNKAIEYQKLGLNIFTKAGYTRGEGVACGNLGEIYQSIGNYQEAIVYQDKRLEVAKRNKNRREEGNAYGGLGNAYNSLGDYRKAIKCHENHLAIAKEIDDKMGEGSAYGNLGADYKSLGNYHKALKHYETSLAIAKGIGDRTGEAYAYGNLGGAHQYLGEFNMAIEYYKESLKISQEIKDKTLEEYAYGNLGISYKSLGKYKMAIEYYEKNLAIAKEIEDRSREGAVHVNMGTAFLYSWNGEKAIQCYKEGLRIAQEIKDIRGEGIAYGNLGLAYLAFGEQQTAIKCFERRLNIAKEIGDRQGEALSYHNIGISYNQETGIEDLAKSKENLRNSIQCYEKLFAELEEKDQFKISIVDTFIKTYKILTEVHIKNGEIEDALLACERGRAQALRDLLRFQFNTIEHAESIDRSLEMADIQSIASKCDSCIVFYNLNNANKASHIWALSSQSATIFFSHELVPGESNAPKNISSLSTGENCNMNGINLQLAIENSLLSMNVREGMKCEDRSLGLEEDEEMTTVHTTANSFYSNETAVVDFQERFMRPVPAECYEQDDGIPLDVLFQTLVSPVMAQVTQDEVIIIPEGPLFMVPFAALQDPETGRFLSEIKRIRLAPSLTTLNIIQQFPKDRSDRFAPLIIGNPATGIVMYGGNKITVTNLTGAEGEAIEIGKLLGVEPLIRRQATKEAILTKLEQGVSIVHFAAHGSKKNGHIFLAPSRPGTRTRPAEETEYMLTMKEAQKCGIFAQLVVLSCCHTGSGEIRSEGVVGITRAFLAAGARAVVASLWAIDDQATKFFMLKFYAYLKKGESASRSLQQAMKEMRETERYMEPRYWAGFFLIGDDVTINF